MKIQKHFLKNRNNLEINNVVELKAILISKEIPQNENRDKLLDRLADYQTLGSIPKCPRCKGGNLQFSQEKGMYLCKEYLDDTTFVNYNASYRKNEIARGT